MKSAQSYQTKNTILALAAKIAGRAAWHPNQGKKPVERQNKFSLSGAIRRCFSGFVEGRLLQGAFDNADVGQFPYIVEQIPHYTTDESSNLLIIEGKIIKNIGTDLASHKKDRKVGGYELPKMQWK